MTSVFIPGFTLFPLQITAADLQLKSEVSLTQLLIFLGVFVAIILVFVIVSRKGSGGAKSKSGGGGGGGGGFGLFSMLSMHRIARGIGLDNEQIRMLDYVFRIDGATEPEKSIVTPALLDRHFRRAYRVIEQGSNKDQDAQRKLAVLFSTRNLLENSTLGAISSTKQLKDDTTLLITHGKEKIEVNVLSSRNDVLIVEAPTTVLGSQIRIPQGTRLSVIFFTKSNKVFSFETRVVGYGNLHGSHTLNLAHSNQLRFMSQRRFRRRQAAIACFMNLVYVEGSGKKSRLIVDKRRFNGNIADISVGGCSIKSMASIQVGARFKIEFVHRNTTVAALGQVLRINRAGMNSTIHIKFLKVSQKSMNIINAFVYEYANE
ncbi:MAG: PilZ domain-containing protein [Treponema sp.]|nr:PilZ domain-containing protein [Treponema sp.]